MLAFTRRWPAADVIVGLTAATSLFIKPLGPLVFIPFLYYVLAERGDRWARLGLMLAGAAVPVVIVTGYLLAQGTVFEFWQQVVVDNSNVGVSLGSDWVGYLALAVLPLVVPLFAALILVDRRPGQLEWWLTVAIFVGLLIVEVLRGARHYGLLNLCLLAWWAVRAQATVNWRNRAHTIGLGVLAAFAGIAQALTIGQILGRGSVSDELSAANFVQTLPRGTLQVFANDPPRIYLLLNDLVPAYAYLFVYDTNKNLVIWDSYTTMMETAPPDYIAVENGFKATEYGQSRSSEFTDAAAVKDWIEHQANYQRLEVGQPLGLTMYQHLVALRRD
jgi:uncharacterized membrane protein